ncbi:MULTISPECIES: branched-chain amino acid ABC transporter permease [Agrobacterium]|uniref:Branched-chain amino acid ABC transporter permease n=1 Tax=Agrobacterium salinitolerans TaxID=1183413 RepID=A0A4Z1RBA6_9HYPH|nr:MULTISPECIES: branched-chain amino acid ABC transporter permease [Agrobacterium]MBA4774156.1 branched-chain amino acid ABC transporter permease [Hyphomicrobiales bacterium]MCZ7855431.1 branched-chain amino acid ABC transporter permease [Agrobacterium salinitolerans]MCZ7890626.1 branched-chain amino acid ABC transporter permease [Agrobacterium salinitolerans]MDA5638203.1 branched-chain amino acid ABC transporter permease [Agrobacterium sp. ST15.13.013]MDA6998090.1 branched-chain amino acid A
MDATIATFLIQDGVTNGAIYALLGLAIVLVFAVTRVIFIPQGEFVAHGALTLALLDAGRVPGTLKLLLCMGAVALVLDLWGMRRGMRLSPLLRAMAINVALPGLIYGLVAILAPMQLPSFLRALITIAIIAPMGYYVYRIAYRPLADASVLVLLIASVGVHLALMGLGLAFFGPEGLRAAPLSDAGFTLGPMLVSAQSIFIYLATILVMVGLYFFFEKTLLGKALKATAINRLGARLVGVRTELTGVTAFVLAAAIAAISGVLIGPITTIFYDTGFLIGLKGFVAAILGGMASFPVTAIAAIGVGLIEAFASFFASDFKEIIVFGLIVPVLIWLSFGASHHEEE